MRRTSLISRRALLGGLSAGAMAAALLGGTPQAAAAPADPAATIAVRAPLSPDVRQAASRQGLSSAAALRAYWTPERMRAAIPVRTAPRAGAGTNSTAAPGPSRKVAPAAPTVPRRDRPAAGSRPGAITAAAAPSATATVGKVFYRNAVDGLNYVCSAGTVNSGSKRLVSTAGHCVHGGGAGGTWHQNWTFVPYYNYGNRPYGTWSASWLVAFNGWTNNGNFDYDVGFVKTFDLNGQQIVNAVGGNGLETGQSKSRAMTILGYPAEAPYPGDWQYYCTGTTSASGNRIQMACPLTRGVSGGPWLTGYDSSTGLGNINGTSSTTNSTRTTLWSPYFSSSVWDLYLYTEGL